MVSVGQELRSHLAGWLWLDVSHVTLVSTSAGAVVIWKLDGVGHCILQDNSLTSWEWTQILASWWWRLLKDLNSFPHWSLHRPAYVSSWHGSWLHLEHAIQETMKEAENASMIKSIYSRALRPTSYCHTRLVTQPSLNSLGRKPYEGVSTRKERSLEPSGGWLPQG